MVISEDSLQNRQFYVIPRTDQEGTGGLWSCQGHRERSIGGLWSRQGHQRLAVGGFMSHQGHRSKLGQFYVLPQDIVKGVLAVLCRAKDSERR